jgi:hypothetical protein
LVSESEVPDMSIDYDSAALRRILQDLRSDDPEFVHSFEAEVLYPAAADGDSGSSLIWISASVAASILAVVLLMLGSFGSATLLGAAAWFAASRGLPGADDTAKRRSEWP